MSELSIHGVTEVSTCHSKLKSSTTNCRTLYLKIKTESGEVIKLTLFTDKLDLAMREVPVLEIY